MSKLMYVDTMNDLVKVVRTCPQCKKEQALEVKYSSYVKWQEGALIQNAFAELSATDREVLKTGICGNCWEEIFADFDHDTRHLEGGA
jgi:hypothetical protein